MARDLLVSSISEPDAPLEPELLERPREKGVLLAHRRHLRPHLVRTLVIEHPVDRGLPRRFGRSVLFKPARDAAPLEEHERHRRLRHGVGDLLLLALVTGALHDGPEQLEPGPGDGVVAGEHG